MTGQAYALSITAEDLTTKTPTQLIEKAYEDGRKDALKEVSELLKPGVARIPMVKMVYAEIQKLLEETK